MSELADRSSLAAEVSGLAAGRIPDRHVVDAADTGVSAPLVITEQITTTPMGGGWFYVRTWHMAGHHQSGIDCVERISPYVIISEAAAMAEAHRSGVHIDSDRALLELWENNGSVH